METGKRGIVPGNGNFINPGSVESPNSLHPPGKEKEDARLKTENSLKFLVFTLEGQGYAMPLAQVEQALRMVSLVHIPDAPPWISGLINFHGHVIPVINLRMRLAQPQRAVQLDDRLIVVRGNGLKIAFIVDDVSEVLEIPKERMASPPDVVSESGPLKAVFQQDEDLILVLDAHRLMPSDEEALLLKGYNIPGREKTVKRQIGNSPGEK